MTCPFEQEQVHRQKHDETPKHDSRNLVKHCMNTRHEWRALMLSRVSASCFPDIRVVGARDISQSLMICIIAMICPPPLSSRFTTRQKG